MRTARPYSVDDALDDEEADLAALDRYNDGRPKAAMAPVGAHYGYHHRRRRHARMAGARAGFPEEELGDLGEDYLPEDVRARDDLDYIADDRVAAALAAHEDAAAVSEMAHAGVPLDHGAVFDDAEEENMEVPVQWKTARFPFRVEVSLAELQRTKKAGIEVDFGRTYAKHKAVQDLLASEAYLGGVRVTQLRHNAPVSLAMRAESKLQSSAGVSLEEPREFLAAVAKPVHAVISKRQPVGAGMDVELRRGTRVAPTWLSRYEWNVGDLDKKTQPAISAGVQEISTDHPVAHFLADQGVIEEADMANSETVHASQADFEDAKAAIIKQEANNPKIADAKSLRLVFVLAHGKLTSAGAPAWSDTTELMDDYSSELLDRKKAIRTRQGAPIVIEGKWELSYGHPLVSLIDEAGEDFVDAAAL